MSSSLYLARALEIFPEYAKVRVDIVGMIGDRDFVEKSILDAREWTTRSDSASWSFCLVTFIIRWTGWNLPSR